MPAPMGMHSVGPGVNNCISYSGLIRKRIKAKAIGINIKHISRVALLGCQNHDLTLDAYPLANRVSHRFQNVGQASADLVLDLDGSDDQGQVVAVDAAYHAVQRLAETATQLNLADHPIELGAGRMGQLPGNPLYGLQ